VEDGLVQFNKEATWSLALWMDANLMFKEHHNRCRKKASAAAAQLRVLTKMYRMAQERVRAVVQSRRMSLCGETGPATESHPQ